MKLYNLALWWTYFNNGYSFASFPKWILAVYGIGEIVNKNYLVVSIYSLLFLIFCFGLGWFVVKSGFLEALNEVQNKNNLFVKEIRKRKNI